MKRRLTDKVKRFILDNRLLDGSPGTVVLGISGGADSVCLLHLLCTLKAELGIDLHVAHLNHGLRGAESDADAEYVSELVRSLGIASTIEKRDVSRYREEHHLSEEEAAREVRYRFFAEVAEQIGAGQVLVGHTANDQAETVLMHLVRGTGLVGLGGMRPLSDLKLPGGVKLTVARPLLGASRQETEVYCREHALSPRQDSSNLSPKYLRNRIRSELIPALSEYNPNIVETLSRSAEVLAADMAYISAEASKLWGTVAREIERGVSIDNNAFNRLPLSLKYHLLRLALERLLGDTRDIGQPVIDSVIDLLAGPSAGKRLSLPGGLFLHGGYEKNLICFDTEVPSDSPRIEGEHPLPVPGEVSIPGWRVRVDITSERGESSDYKAFFDLDRTGKNLILRSRREGDRFHPLGMTSSKKLQDFLLDIKLPRSDRDRVPLLCAGGEIIWVVGHRIDDRFKVTSATERFLCIEFVRI